MRTFTAEERRTMFGRLPAATSMESGLFLLGANGAMPLADVVMMRREELASRLDAACRSAHVKSGSPINFFLWDETRQWASERWHGPNDVYVFPEFVFSEEALVDNPSLNQVPLTAAEESARRYRATMRARNCFQEFLRRCGICRAGLWFRSFRFTNIPYRESVGVPRRVARAVTGHKVESGYLTYVLPTEDQLSALAQLTLDHYKSAFKPKACLDGKWSLQN